jgi:hypothetical protein
MIKFCIAALVIVGLSIGGYNIWQYWGHYKNSDSNSQQPAYVPPPPGDSFPGMPSSLEATYQASKARGVAGLRDFIKEYGNSVSDPRLASIQLDYVILLAQSDPSEAKRIFNQVKNRTQSDSPVYSRVQQLAKTYE